MKRLLVILFLSLGVSIYSYSQKLSFDAKYIKVGVVSNDWSRQLSDNPNIRNLGNIGYSYSENGTEIAKRMSEAGVGRLVLDRLFQRDGAGLHVEHLYETALQNTIFEEIEVALQDASAEVQDVLKRDIAKQLLKNNYIVLSKTVNLREGKAIPKMRTYWQVFYVDITDRIIEQAYSNWQDLSVYDQIKIPIRFVAKGKSKINEFIFDIAKKVPAFAVRGSVFNRKPFLARTSSSQGVKKMDRFYIYRFKENRKGEIYSKKVCTARATEINNESTRLYTISGKYASTKKGDVAVQRDRHKSSFSLMGQYSAGNDPRFGGRLQFEQLLNFSKYGVAQYFLAALEYNQYKNEPEGIWWNYDKKESIQPKLNNAAVMLGYGIGFNFLGKIELVPYMLAGYQNSFLFNSSDNLVYWNKDLEVWDSLNDDKSGELIKSGNAIVGYTGIKININIWYPVQMTIGADYNLTVSLTKSFKPILSRHEQNRLNIYAGLRINF